MKSLGKSCGRAVNRMIILCFGAFAVTTAPTFIHAQSDPVPVPPEAIIVSEEWKTATPETAPVYQWERSSIPPATPTPGAATWVEQGPGPILFESNTRLPPDNPASGAVNAVAPSPTNPNLLYVGTVNGGIWRTTNLTAVDPTWTPLTDQQLPALSIRSLAISPADPNTIFAGTGSSSSLASLGSPGFGVARSTDGGETWTVLAASTFAGKRITSIVPTSLDGGNVVLASTDTVPSPGVYRSTDGGNSFNLISGSGGLPSGSISSLVADPGNPSRFYAGRPTQGIFRSDDGGLTWTSVNTGLTGLSAASRILLSVHNSAGNNVVYAALIGSQLNGVFRTTDQGGSWTSMGVPSPAIHPGGQGSIHGAIAAHPSDPNVVFISGDRQDGPFPNVNGCNTFNANIFRGNAAQLPANPWQSAVCNGANGTAPHADARAMAFDAAGNLLHADDGSISRLLSPDNQSVRQWDAVGRGIRAVEIHSVAYDPLSKVIFGGTQDNGTPIQSGPSEFVWPQLRGGDGGNVAVDTDQTAHPGTTIRYTSSQNFGFFNRTTWDASNNRIGGFTQVQLRITSGPGSGLTLFQFDPNIQFYQPYVLNAIDPTRMLIGTANIYESLNRGDSLTNLGFTGFFIGDFLGSISMAYGGRFNGEANPDVFYVGAGLNIFHRVNIGDPITTLSAYPGARIRGLVIDPLNYRTIYVLDFLNRVWASFDEGGSWSNLTANLPSLSSDIRTIKVVSREAAPNASLIVGGLGGVFQMPNPGSPGGNWSVLGRELPPALVRDLQYNVADDVLAAALFGRGASLLPNVSQEIPFKLVNDLVSFEPIGSSFTTTSDTSGCPSGFVGKFGFAAKLTNLSGSLFSGLVTQAATLTGDNLLQNADTGPGGVGSRLTVPKKDGFADGVLSSGEFVDVPFVICLKQTARFEFSVNVLAIVDVGPVASAR
jgi:hypothetical protein